MNTWRIARHWCGVCHQGRINFFATRLFNPSPQRAIRLCSFCWVWSFRRICGCRRRGSIGSGGAGGSLKLLEVRVTALESKAMRILYLDDSGKLHPNDSSTFVTFGGFSIDESQWHRFVKQINGAKSNFYPNREQGNPNLWEIKSLEFMTAKNLRRDPSVHGLEL